MHPIAISRRLARQVESLRFGRPTACVYNPLVYARRPHEAYLRRYAAQGVDTILVGMTPGPWGMAQTGVPFGEVGFVRDFLGIDERVDRPAVEHPKRPVEGFACTRSEVSGQRLWGWAHARYRTARVALGDAGPPIGTILHPSPAANRGWARQAEQQLLALGICFPNR
ncbi:hypothetical protein EBR04_05710 [bacterium]|nr:hypothetical protein [bacterium]